jgi:hypothetical protein
VSETPYDVANHDPAWSSFRGSHHPGSVVSGQVVLQLPYGFWLDLGGVFGLVEIISFRDGPGPPVQVEDFPAIGSSVEAVVLGFHDASKEVRMGTRRSDFARSQILGGEFDWLAVDSDGHIGMLSTAGGGRAPRAVLVDVDAHDAALEALMACPATTSARFFPQVREGLENDWRAAAERGVFAFDSDVYGSPYRLVAAPVRPIVLAGLPLATAKAAGRVRLGHLCFATVGQGDVITVEGHDD